MSKKAETLTPEEINKLREQILEDSKKYHIEDSEKKVSLDSAIFDMTRPRMSGSGSDYTYFGSILQVMNINYSQQIPTAAIIYDTRYRRYNIALNPYFFTRVLATSEERVAVLVHEISHFTHFHLPQEFVATNEDNRMLLNVAQDLAINQYIPNLPSLALQLSQFRSKDGTPFPAGKHFSYYYNELLNDAEIQTGKGKGQPQEDEGSGEGDGQGDGQGQEASGSGKGKGKSGSKPDLKGQQQPGDGQWSKAKDHFKNPRSAGLDDHGGEGEEGSAYEKLEAMKDIMKRAYNKHVRDYGTEPGGIKDLLQKIDGTMSKMDYKKILLMALKTSLPAKNFERTWHRDSRRYGNEAPGSRLKRMPRITIYTDTSGSISHEELNKFLRVTEGFFTHGVEKANIKFFHTELYGERQIKKNFKINPEDVQSGGTDLTCIFEDMKKNRPDLCVIVTDGYYGMPEVSLKGLPPTVFVISEEGDMNHCLKSVGKTVRIAT